MPAPTKHDLCCLLMARQHQQWTLLITLLSACLQRQTCLPIITVNVGCANIKQVLTVCWLSCRFTVMVRRDAAAYCCYCMLWCCPADCSTWKTVEVRPHIAEGSWPRHWRSMTDAVQAWYSLCMPNFATFASHSWKWCQRNNKFPWRATWCNQQ